VRSHSHRGENDDIYLGVTKEPEQVLPQQRMAAGMIDGHSIHDDSGGDEETRSTDAIKNQEGTSTKETRKRKQTKNGTNEQPPLGQGKPHHRKPASPHRQNGCDVIQTTHQT